MTAPQPDPPLAADELVAAGTEREVLEAFLDFHREVLVRKVSGVSEQEARYRRVPSRTTLAGLIKHMIGVERGWFQRVLAERPAEEIGPNVGGGDDSWDLQISCASRPTVPPAWTADLTGCPLCSG
jgi:Protein of unknown function (DUF664)